MAIFNEVSHCYQRNPAKDWPYNLYTMIHALSEESCKEIARKMSETANGKRVFTPFQSPGIKENIHEIFCILTHRISFLLIPGFTILLHMMYGQNHSGLLQLASILRNHGYTVSYIDCLNRFHKRAPKSNPYARHGRGPYLKKRIPKPHGFKDIPRYFSRYGIKKEWLKEDLLSIRRPDLILVTTMMTYWYPGTIETISVLKEFYPDVPVVLGGIYPTLCEDHAARHSGADIVITGAGGKKIIDLAGRLTGFPKTPEFNFEDMDALPYPSFDLQSLLHMFRL